MRSNRQLRKVASAAKRGSSDGPIAPTDVSKLEEGPAEAISSFLSSDKPGRCKSESKDKRLQLLGGEGDEFAAGVFVSLDDPTLVDLLASCGIMRPKRDPGGCGALVSIKAGIVDEEPRRRWRRTLLPFTLIGPSVLGHIDRRWLPHLVQANGFRALRSAR